MNIPPNVTNYVVHLKNNRTERELHDMFSFLEADEDAMKAWNLTEDDFFAAVEIAYFAPEEISSTLQ